MFESFFEMGQTAFSRNIPTDELYESNQLEEIIGRLNYAAERQLFAVMTGECGLGKTTAIRRFTEQLDPSRYKLLYLSDSKLTPRHFYKGMLEQLGLESKKGSAAMVLLFTGSSAAQKSQRLFFVCATEKGSRRIV